MLNISTLTEFYYLCAMGEGFGAGGVTLPNACGSVLQKAAPYNREQGDTYYHFPGRNK